MVKIKLDLHEINNRGDKIEEELNRVEKDDKIFGRIFVQFRHKSVLLVECKWHVWEKI